MTEATDAEGQDAPDDPGEPTRARQRLQGLLRATTSVVERLDLDVVLRRIVEAGMTLVGAKYGALGVIAADGTLERFIHVGIDPATAARIGHLPTGKGILGTVIAERHPIRLDHLSADPRSAGFPSHHPPMESFLGVPVRAGDQVYGNLYLTDGRDGPFRSEDEELIVSLAATAGIAIENARLYDAARTRELWQATIADVMTAMLAATGDNVLEVIAQRLGEAFDAALVAVATPLAEDELLLSAVHGAGGAALRGRAYPVAGTLPARALSTGTAVSVVGQAEGEMFDGQPRLGPTVAIPLSAGGETLGVLMISRREGETAFTDADLEMAFTFAAQTSIALEIVRAREDRRRLETTQDRARIARELHDNVIQRLFGAGLSLQAVSALVAADASEAIDSQIDVIDETIKDIRTIIFALSGNERTGVRGLRDRLLDVTTEVTASWATSPRLSFRGPLDSLVTPSLADDLVAVLRELLTNVVKHAHADIVAVTAAIVDDHVELEVVDDGVGVPDAVPRSGLANIADRALLRGGGCEVTARPEGGTTVRWRVPTDAGEDTA